MTMAPRNQSSPSARTAFLAKSTPESLPGKAAVGYRLSAARRKEAGEYEQAIADYEKAIELEPCNGNHYFFIGLCYSHLGEKEAALSAFQTASFLYHEQGSQQAALSSRWIQQIAAGRYPADR